MLKAVKWTFVLLLYTAVLPNSSSQKGDFRFGSRYTSIKCRADNSSVMLRYCHLKAYSRRLVTANIGVTMLKSLKAPIIIEIIYSYRYGTVYRDVIHSPKLEWCGIMSGSFVNPIVSNLMAEIRSSASNLFRKCPYEGELDIVNMTSAHENDKKTSMLWEGFYKFEVFVYRNDKEVFYLDLGNHIKSGLKDSFG